MDGEPALKLVGVLQRRSALVKRIVRNAIQHDSDSVACQKRRNNAVDFWPEPTDLIAQ